MRNRGIAAALIAGLLAGSVAGVVAVSAGAAGRPASATAASRQSRAVSSTLARLLRAGAIAEADYRRYVSAYAAARRSLGRLSGTRAEELGAVLANVQAIAAAGAFTPSRLPALFLTLERNRQWWTTEPLLSGGERVSFPSSGLVWEYYPGQGIEIQWLGTFGRANGYFLSGHENENLRQLLSEVLPLATQRAGGIAWEYLFRFDGGLPPWTSGLSQGTAIQVLARAWSRFKDPALLAAAQQALGIFRQAPPGGVRVATPAGAQYVEYSYAPSDHILNGFVQALVGLYDYASITKDPLGLSLFEAGDAQARLEVPHFDTGGWSLYDQYGESSLNYHELLTEFLQHLCSRTRKGPPIAPAVAPAAAGGAGTSSPSTPAGPPPSGGTSSPAGSTPQSPVPIAADAVYCTTAERFSADLTTPPAITLLTSTLRGGTRGGVMMSLSKISTVSMTVRQGSRVVWTNTATVEHGRPRLLWVTPARGGSFLVSLTATDLAGNFATTSGTIVVRRH